MRRGSGCGAGVRMRADGPERREEKQNGQDATGDRGPGSTKQGLALLR